MSDQTDGGKSREGKIWYSGYDMLECNRNGWNAALDAVINVYMEMSEEELYDINPFIERIKELRK